LPVDRQSFNEDDARKILIDVDTNDQGAPPVEITLIRDMPVS
jgi:hypothetical protein